MSSRHGHRFRPLFQGSALLVMLAFCCSSFLLIKGQSRFENSRAIYQLNVEGLVQPTGADRNVQTLIPGKAVLAPGIHLLPLLTEARGPVNREILATNAYERNPFYVHASIHAP